MADKMGSIRAGDQKDAVAHRRVEKTIRAGREQQMRGHSRAPHSSGHPKLHHKRWMHTDEEQASLFKFHKMSCWQISHLWAFIGRGGRPSIGAAVSVWERSQQLQLPGHHTDWARHKMRKCAGNRRVATTCSCERWQARAPSDYVVTCKATVTFKVYEVIFLISQAH